MPAGGLARASRRARAGLLCGTDLVHTTDNSSGGRGSVDAAQLDLANSRAEIDALVSQLVGALDARAYLEPSKFAVRLALEEAISNSFRHGHRGLPRETPVRVEYRVGSDEVVVRVIDQGPGFDPGEVPDPTLDENLELPSGRGLMLIRAYMTRVEFEGAGNVLNMVYERPKGR